MSAGAARFFFLDLLSIFGACRDTAVFAGGKCCGISVWQPENSVSPHGAGGGRLVAPKVRCTGGQKCFCRAGLVRYSIQRMVFFVMTISFQAAVGLRWAPVKPSSGSFYHRDRVPAEMKSRLELITLWEGDASPRHALSSRAAQDGEGPFLGC